MTEQMSGANGLNYCKNVRMPNAGRLHVLVENIADSEIVRRVIGSGIGSNSV